MKSLPLWLAVAIAAITVSCTREATVDAGGRLSVDGNSSVVTPVAVTAETGNATADDIQLTDRDLEQVLTASPGESPGPEDRWHNFASGIHPPPDEATLAHTLGLATSVFVGEIVEIADFYIPPGNQPDAGPEDPVTGTIRLRVQVSSVIDGDLPIRNADGSVYIDLPQISTSAHLDRVETPRGSYVFIVASSEIVPQAWSALERQSDAASVAAFRKKYEVGYSLITRASIIQTWRGGFRAPLLEADLVAQVPDVFLSSHDRNYEVPSDAHSHGDGEQQHSHAPEGPEGIIPALVTELEKTSIATLEQVVKDNPIPGLSERRATWLALSPKRLPSSEPSN